MIISISQKRTFLLNLFSIVISLALNAQSKIDDRLLIEDYNIFKTIIGELSPDFSDMEKKDFYNYFDNRIGELKGKSMTVLEFVDFLSRSKAKTKLDGHGQITVPEEIMMNLLGSGNALFPVPILIEDNQLIVNSVNAEIPFGSIITEINGEPITAIINNLVSNKDTATLRNLENSFDIFYLIKYGVPETFKISFSAPLSETVESIVLIPIDVNKRKEIYSKNIFPLNRDQLQKTINTTYFKEQDCFYLQLNSFNWKDGKTNDLYKTFKEEFETVFKAIDKQKPQNLSIDLRYNGGGDLMIPGLLYSFIAKSTFTEDIAMKVPDFIFPHKNYITKIENQPLKDTTVINGFFDWYRKNFKLKDNFYQYNLIDNVKVSQQKRSFEGHVYLLIGGRTTSASSYFTALFKNDKRGVIVGEQIGSTHHQITAGKIIQYTLPNTKIEVSMPIGIINFSKELEVNIPEDKIMPDVEVGGELKYNYILKKEDPEIQEVFRLIEKNKT